MAKEKSVNFGKVHAFVVMLQQVDPNRHPSLYGNRQSKYRARSWLPSIYNGPMDALLNATDAALRTLFATPRAARACPEQAPGELTDAERRHAGGLMRVNHVGEICAQALYTAQAFSTRDEALRAQFVAASAQETDHLAWTRERLRALGERPSLLNPLWYAGAFGLGLLAGWLGDARSLGFVLETETQVEAHLASHLSMLPPADLASRAIVAQMQKDEARHALDAEQAGARELPAVAKKLMQVAARVMTSVAYRI